MLAVIVMVVVHLITVAHVLADFTPPSAASAGRRRPGGVEGMHRDHRPAGGSRRGHWGAAEMAMVGVHRHGAVERKRHKFVGCNTVGILVLGLCFYPEALPILQ